MRTLILLRHAAAASQQLAGRDFDRALTAAGHAEAEAAAGRLAALEPRPQLLLASPAVRTRLTAEILARALDLRATQQREDSALYLASAPTLRAAIARSAASIGCLVLVGHNPGLSELATALDGRAGHTELATASFARFDLALPDWTLP